MRSPVFFLDYDDESLPPVESAVYPVASFPPPVPEPDATAHWIFGGSDASLADIVDSASATPQNTPPVYAPNFLTLAGTLGNALMTPVDDALGLILFAVIKKRSGGRVYFGTVGVAEETSGWGVNSTSMVLGVRQRGDTGSVAANYPGYSDVEDGEWMFVAAYSGNRADAGNTPGVIIHNGSARAQSAMGTITPGVSSRKIALGNAYFSGIASVVDVAEFGIITGQQLTEEYGRALYSRAERRMRERGILVHQPV